MSIMRMRSILLLFFVLTLAAAHADTIELKGRITLLDGNMPPAVAIHPYSDESVSIPAVVSGGAFTLHIPATGAGQYNLRFGNASYDIMLSPSEKEAFISIKLGGNQLKDLHVEKSNENEAYKNFISQVKLYDAKIRKHFLECEKEESCNKALHEILTDYAAELESIKAKYKGTYTAEVLCKMRMPTVAKDVKNTAAELRAGYFENVPFGDINILGNPTYKDMIDLYVESLIEPKYSKEDAFIRDLMNRAKADTKVLTQSAGFLYESLFRRSREKMLGMYIAWYKENKAAVNNPVVDAKVQNISKVMPGATYIDIVRKDVTGKQVSLKDMVSKSACTMLLFWSSDCSHCREEMPYVREMYEKYHSQGLDIYAVSLEQDKDKWRSYIVEKGLTWTNVTNLRETGGNPAVDYVTTFTPTVVMIDKNGVILHRFVSKNKMEKYIQEALK